jgi:site-specific DNA-adenine methylase
MTKPLKAPFPYFGGKSSIAEEVWKRFGKVNLYVEPFCGSCAVLLGRPVPFSGFEVVNDKDGLLSNFWRALKHDPNGVAEHANWPVNEADLHARHLWLVQNRKDLTERLMGDMDYWDSQVAGYWVWGLSSWIGDAWCTGDGSWGSVDGVFRKLDSDTEGVRRKMPRIGRMGGGIHSLLSFQYDGKDDGVHTGYSEINSYLEILAKRLRYVKVLCGDWKRPLAGGSIKQNLPAAIFLDPPYLQGDIDYSEGHRGLGDEVREWCIENGTHPDLRIALCGYEGDHNELEELGWTTFEWKTNGGYGKTSKGGSTKGKENRFRERIWFSPHCLNPNDTVSILDMFKSPEESNE